MGERNPTTPQPIRRDAETESGKAFCDALDAYVAMCNTQNDEYIKEVHLPEDGDYGDDRYEDNTYRMAEYATSIN